MALFLGRLAPDTRSRDLEDLFAKYGRVTRLDIKRGTNSDFGFVEYEDPRDADEAVHKLNGSVVNGKPIVVEFAKNNGRRAGDNECFKCGKEGHWARDCRDGGRYSDRRRSSRSPRRREYRDRSRSRSPGRRRDFREGGRRDSRDDRRESRDDRRDSRDDRRESRRDFRDDDRRKEAGDRGDRDRDRSPAPRASGGRSPSPDNNGDRHLRSVSPGGKDR
ncbi:hypothetical protein BGX31_000382 [Mortierella sp. GBA43]|nr:hypothetical protein BGX31_000382 [Mortierella sp. GBA43]